MNCGSVRSSQPFLRSRVSCHSSQTSPFWPSRMLSQAFQPFDLSSKASCNADELPHCSLKVGVVRSKGIVGSSYFEFGDSKIMCCVMCPRAGARQSQQSATLDHGSFEVDVRYASHIVQEDGRSEGKLAKEESASSWVQNALQSAILLQFYPKQLISVSVNILQSSQYDLSAIVNGVSLALADASVQMRDLTCSYSMFLTRKVSHSTTSDEEKSTSFVTCAEFTVAMLPALQVTSNTHIEGRWSRDTIAAADRRLSSKCDDIRKLMVSQLNKSL